MIIDELVNRLNEKGPAWLWFATSMRNGDMFHAVAFVQAFKQEHGHDLPIRLVINTRSQLAICSIFEEHFDSIHLEPQFLPSETEWIEFFLRHQLSPFAPNVPIVIHPHRNVRTSLLNVFISQNKIVWGQLYKSALHLPSDVEPASPPLRESRSARAVDLLLANGMPRGRSMIFFPYAQSFPVPGEAHFAALADQASTRGWSVFTSVAHGEQAIAGTRPVFLPFDILLEVVEEAGWIVAVRSGVCDITATARCKKTYIFRSRADLQVWGVDSLELSRDSNQITFPFETYSPQEFCQNVLEIQGDGLTVTPRALSDALIEAIECGSGHTLDFVDIQRGATTKPKHRRRFGNRNRSIRRLINLPSRRHPRLEGLAMDAISIFTIEQGRRARFYTCRDTTRGLDYLEEVDLKSLLEGRYAAADNWHTLIVSQSQGLQDILPERLQARLLPRTPVVLGRYDGIGDAIYDPGQIALQNGDRALDIRGLQFLRGWSQLEPWGVWSEGESSVLKLSFKHVPTGVIRLELDAIFLVTQVSGKLNLIALVNGSEVLAREFVETEKCRLEILIPPDLIANSTAYVEFQHAGARSPLRLGDSDDRRRMALGLTGFKVVQTPDHAA